MKKIRIALTVLLTGLMFGCATKPADPASLNKAAKEKEAEYVQVEGGLGSRIPRRIKKENVTRATVGGGTTERATGEEVRDALDNPMPALPPPGANP